MKTRKTLLSLLIAGALSLSLAACKSITPEDVAEGAKASLAAIENYRMNHKLSGEISSDAVTETIASDYDFEVVESPVYKKIVTKDSYNGEESINTMYIVEEGGSFSTYILYEDAWIRQDLDDSYSDYVKDYYSYPKTLENLFDKADSFALAGREKTENGSFIKGKLTFKGDNIKEALSAINAASMDVFGQGTAFFGEDDILEFTIHFDDKTYMPVKYDSDLTPAMQKVFDVIYGGADHVHEDGTEHNHIDITVANYAFESSISDINSLENTSLPSEVASATTFEEHYADLMSEYYTEQAEEIPEE